MTRSFSLLFRLLLVAGLVLAAPAAWSQDAPSGGLSRDLQLAFSQTPANLSNGYTPEGPGLESLAEAPSGTQKTIPVLCPPGSECAGGILMEWVAQVEFPYGAAFTGNANFTFRVAPPDNPAGAGPEVPLGVANNAEIVMEVGRISPEGTTHWHDKAAFPVNTDPTTPTSAFPSEATFSIPVSDLEIPEGGLFIARLSWSSQGAASFKVVYDGGSASQLVSAPYRVGGPNAVDTDGDGIPDEFDADMDGDGFSNDQEAQVGSAPNDPASTPLTDSAACPGYTHQEVFDATGNPATCPDEGGFPWLLILLILLGIVILAGAGFLVTKQVGRAVDVEVSDEGFASVEKGKAATFEVTVTHRGKKMEQDVVLAVGGLPEDWSAKLQQERMLLAPAGDESGRDKATTKLTVTPPPGEEYEAEGVAIIEAQPLDADGNPKGTPAKAKAKTIVNIGVERPAGEAKPKKGLMPKLGKRKRTEAGQGEEEEGDADAVQGQPKRKRFGFGKRKGAQDAAGSAGGEDEEVLGRESPATPEADTQPSGAAAAGGAVTKPRLAISKLTHDPSNFRRGDTVKSSVSVTNDGDEAVKGLKLSLFVNDSLADSKTIDVKPGKSKDVSFKWTAQPDKNKIYVRGDLA